MSSPKQISDLRAGVIGAGFIGPVHMEALRRLGVTVAALCDAPGLVEKAQARLNIPQAYTDYKKMVAAEDLDVIHITAPNKFHCEMSLAALKAGKNVVCEKPLAMDTKETAEIIKVAKSSKSVFAVNYNLRFYPAVLTLKQMVANGELGDIIHVNGSYMQDWLFKETDYNWRLLPEAGGKLRGVADIGTHWMDTVNHIMGTKIKSVLADLSIFHKTRKRPIGEINSFAGANADQKYADYQVKTEDFSSVLLQFSNGARGNLGVSQVAAGRKNCMRIEIYGSKKSAWWSSEEPETISFGNRDGNNEVAFRGTPSFAGAAGFSDYPPGHVEGFPDTFKMLFRNIYSTIIDPKNTKRLFADVHAGHEEVAVCEAILASAKSKTWEKV